MDRQDLIDEVKKSNLRGRGGAGFNCGQKWNFAYLARSDQKYVICNADEGEPGTYKDRMIMENDPHTLLEGMAICAYAIGADKGYIYCRGEYPQLVKVLNTAIIQAKAKGLMDGFDIELRSGAGAYVCGEETALIESLEGKRGEPRIKPPYPPVEGLWQKPTIVNNVETFANIPVIVEKGASWYAAIGCPKYPGTKVLTLTGDINNSTFFEVPTNTTIRVALAEEIGLDTGKLSMEVLVAGLRKIGFDYVLHTNFTADLTIMEEGNELLKRLKEGGTLPMFTSCSPGWINYCETYYPDLLDNLSTCKSPQQMFGALVKTYWAEKIKISAEKIYSVSIMPCTAKKFEASRPEMRDSGYQDVDLVLTTREIGRFFRMSGIDFAKLQGADFDSWMGAYSGAAVIFGASGGVMEAALRTVYEVLTSYPLLCKNQKVFIKAVFRILIAIELIFIQKISFISALTLQGRRFRFKFKNIQML